MKEEIRCGNCRRLLAKGQVVEVQIKCPRCGTMNHLKAIEPPTSATRSPVQEQHDGEAKKQAL